MRHYSNTAVQTALLAGVTAADPSLTVVDANGYPATPFAIVVDPGDALQEEVMLVTAAAGAAWTVTRGATPRRAAQDDRRAGCARRA